MALEQTADALSLSPLGGRAPRRSSRAALIHARDRLGDARVERRGFGPRFDQSKRPARPRRRAYSRKAATRRAASSPPALVAADPEEFGEARPQADAPEAGPPFKRRLVKVLTAADEDAVKRLVQRARCRCSRRGRCEPHALRPSTRQARRPIAEASGRRVRDNAGQVSHRVVSHRSRSILSQSVRATKPATLCPRRGRAGRALASRRALRRRRGPRRDRRPNEGAIRGAPANSATCECRAGPRNAR